MSRSKVQKFIAKIVGIEIVLGSKILISDWLARNSWPPEETEEGLNDVEVMFLFDDWLIAGYNGKSYWFVSIRLHA